MKEQQASTNKYLAPHDDGLTMRESGRWVAEKLFYLKRYLDMFSIAMSKKPWRAINYIDLFSGPGKCCVRDGDVVVYLGSPLLALTAPRPFTNYFFADSDGRTIDVLRKRVSTSPQSNRAQYYVGDSNIKVQEIVDYIKQVDEPYIQDKWPSLNLAFLDPEGLELHWKTVAILAEVRTDLIIHYSEMGITRNAPNFINRDEDTAIDRYFGGREWRTSYGESRRSKRRLLKHYIDKLRQLGYEEVKRDDELWNALLIRSSSKRTPLYRLLFASRSPLGHQFWQKVASENVYGQRRLF